MKKFSKILVYLLATTCLSSTLSFSKPEEEFFVEAETLSSTTTTTNPTSKIVYENVEVSKPENPASVAAALNSAKDGTTTGVSLLLADNFNEEFIPPNNPDLTMEEAQEILRTRRAKVKAHYDNINAKIAKALNIDNLSDDYYISSYAPFISIELGENVTTTDIRNINTLAASNVVSTVFVKQVEPKEENQEVLAIDNTENLEEQAAEFMQQLNSRAINYDATGIRVGLLDLAVVDTTHPNMKKYSDPESTAMINCQTYIAEGHSYSTNKNHATAVATILTGQYGIAKNLSLFSAESTGSSIYDEIEWMINNYVDIINLSWSRVRDTEKGEYCGEYTSEALYLDYISRTCATTIVKAVGNYSASNPYDNIGRTHGFEFAPPVGYNMLVVGSCNNDGELLESSCYVEATDCVDGQGDICHTSINIPPLEVPHVIAFGDYGIIPSLSGNDYTGTSFAAPYVTGGIALLMKKKSELMITPFMNSALVMATAIFLEDYNNSSAMAMGLHEQVGVGEMDIFRLLSITENNYTYTIYRDDIYYNTVCQKTFYAEKNQIVQIATCNMVNVDDSNISFAPNTYDTDFGIVDGFNPTEIQQAIKATDYGLYLCDSNGNTLYFCDTEYNTEYLRVVIPKTGNYTIKIRQMSDSGEDGPITREDYIGLAYYLS